MPRRIQTKSSRSAIRSTSSGKTFPQKYKRGELRFKVSLVILIGMLTFSMLLLFVSLNKASVARSSAITSIQPSLKYNFTPKKQTGGILDDGALGYKLSIPDGLGTWFYKIGEVRSLTDKSLSDQYLKIYVPMTGTKSNNFDEQNRVILTIRRFTLSEWRATGKDCPDGDICKASGEMITKSADSAGDEWVFAFSKSGDCPQGIADKCAIADKIIESFQMK